MHRMIQSEQQKEGSDACLFSKIGLIMNPDKPDAVRMAKIAEDFFSENGIAVSRLQNDSRDARSVDLILTFGGDGTFLIGARIAIEQDIPLMGINLGTVGFLTEEEPEHLTECLQAILSHRYQTDERFVLEVRVPRTGESFYALNDAVVTRGGFARLIRVECTVNDEQFGIFTADGMIAATPTGSTGYSLSAGGPIVQPGMDCIVLTPVCAHSLQTCPCIVSGTSEIRFRLIQERNQTAELQIDGMDRGKLEAGDEILITGSGRTVKLLRIHPFHFFILLRTKLIEWGTKY